MRSNNHPVRFVVIAALAAAVGIGGCQAGDTGGAGTQARGGSTAGEALPRASAVTATYYYLPG